MANDGIFGEQSSASRRTLLWGLAAGVAGVAGVALSLRHAKDSGAAIAEPVPDFGRSSGKHRRTLPWLWLNSKDGPCC